MGIYKIDLFNANGFKVYVLIDPGVFVFSRNGNYYYFKCCIIDCDTRSYTSSVKVDHYHSVLHWNCINSGWYSTYSLTIGGSANISGANATAIVGGGEYWLDLLSKIFTTQTPERYLNVDTDGYSGIMQYMFEHSTSFHSDPVYIEATKLTYTDGTYNFAHGNKTADQARKAGYNYLLNTYGSFYKGTERELSDTFIKNLTSNV